MNLPTKAYNIFEDFYRPFESLLGYTPSRTDSEVNWMPPVDISKDSKCFTITMDVPGFMSKDIHVEAHDGILSIEGERSERKDSDDENLVRRERYYGRFSRRFSLPDGASTEKITAAVKDGVLTLTVPHATEVQVAPKRITVK